MKVTELAVGVALVLGTTGTAWAALDLPRLRADATTVAARASCRTVDTAIVAYTVDHDAPPVEIAQVEPYVLGDVSGYRIAGGVAAGPGCARPAR